MFWRTRPPEQHHCNNDVDADDDIYVVADVDADDVDDNVDADDVDVDGDVDDDVDADEVDDDDVDADVDTDDVDNNVDDDVDDDTTWRGRVKGIASSGACRRIVHVKAEQKDYSFFVHKKNYYFFVHEKRLLTIDY